MVKEAYSERSQTSKMKLFEKKIFSRPLFQLFTIYTKSSILDVRLRSEYASGTINYFRKRFHLNVWVGSRYPSEMFTEKQKLQKPVNELFLETLQLRLRNNSSEISEKNPTEKWFFQLFSASFVRNPEATIRGVLFKKAVLKNFARFTGKLLCLS